MQSSNGITSLAAVSRTARFFLRTTLSRALWAPSPHAKQLRGVKIDVLPFQRRPFDDRRKTGARAEARSA
jgi:hypothetical protein